MTAHHTANTDNNQVIFILDSTSFKSYKQG